MSEPLLKMRLDLLPAHAKVESEIEQTDEERFRARFRAVEDRWLRGGRARRRTYAWSEWTEHEVGDTISLVWAELAR